MIDWFFKLKEYDSLLRERINYLKAIKDQDDRLSVLKERQQETIADSENHKRNLLDKEQLLFETEKKLKTAEEQASRLADLGGSDEKISHFKSDASTQEEKAFLLLEEIEEIQNTLSECRTFLFGLDNTYSEISKDVADEKEILSQTLAGVDLRLDLILNELPDDFRTVLQRTLARNLAVGPFTRIENGSCYFCRYKISRIEESEIDMQKQLKICPQCSRIFLPYGS